MFRIEMLPAAHGDCLWIEYGSGNTVHRILIDGGPAYTYPALRERILHLPAHERRFDLLVISHVDADHIEGVIRLLLDAEALNCHFDRIWFNGRDQLNAVPDPAGEPLGALQGEILGLLIADYEARTATRVWNTDFDSALVAIDRNTPKLPTIDLPGGCRLTLLSPDFDRLLLLKDRWGQELRKARISSGDETALRRRLAESRSLRPLGDVLGAEGEEVDQASAGNWEVPADDDSDLDTGLDDTLGRGSGEPGADAPFGGDRSPANGSSIAFLMEYPAPQGKTAAAATPRVPDRPSVPSPTPFPTSSPTPLPTSSTGARVLFAGDAWAEVLETSICSLLERPEQHLSLTAFKLPHHGSVANLSASLLGRLRCSHYLVSTSGAIFRHPHPRAIDLILAQHGGAGRVQLHFNYLTRCTQAWSQRADQLARRYLASHPKGVSLFF